jgi:RNA polymerase sigma factor for flagellar operon FliA
MSVAVGVKFVPGHNGPHLPYGNVWPSSRRDDTEINAVWVRYKTKPCPEDRETLILAHLPLVHYMARRVLPSLHESVEYNDLVSYGIFGLIDAIEKFDLTKGIKFSTFAAYRVRGQIIEEMRGLAWEPRSVRQRSRAIAQAAIELENSLGRPPIEAELATGVGITVAELRRSSSDIRASKVRSMDQRARQNAAGDLSATLGERVAAADITDQPAELHEAAALLAAGMEKVPDNERALLQLIYVKGLSLKYIASVLGVTESWVSLLHTRALVVLQRTLAGAAV